jgi:hypothetical protein
VLPSCWRAYEYEITYRAEELGTEHRSKYGDAAPSKQASDPQLQAMYPSQPRFAPIASKVSRAAEGRRFAPGTRARRPLGSGGIA